VSPAWKVYIDDSADQHRKKYVLAGALVGRKADWHTFEKRWNKALSSAPAIPYFHGMDLRRLEGAFAQFRDEIAWPRPTGSAAANAKRDKLRSLIEESPLVAIGVGVLVPDYEKVKASHRLGPTHMSTDVFEWTLQNTLMQTVAAINKVDNDARIAFISDQTNKASRYEAVFADFRKKNPRSAPSMFSLVHLDDKKSAGLQAADMISSVVKGVHDDRFDRGEINENAPLLSKFYRIATVDESYLLTVLNGQSVMQGYDQTE
jgi:hypothetical protein